MRYLSQVVQAFSVTLLLSFLSLFALTPTTLLAQGNLLIPIGLEVKQDFTDMKIEWSDPTQPYVLSYHNGEDHGGWETPGNGGYSISAIRFTTEDLSSLDTENHPLTSIRWVGRESDSTQATIIVWQGGDGSAPGKEYISICVNDYEWGWNETMLPKPYIIDNTQELWIGIRFSPKNPGDIYVIPIPWWGEETVAPGKSNLCYAYDYETYQHKWVPLFFGNNAISGILTHRLSGETRSMSPESKNTAPPSYEVYRNGDLIATLNKTSYTDTDAYYLATSLKYCIKALYDEGASTATCASEKIIDRYPDEFFTSFDDNQLPEGWTLNPTENFYWLSASDLPGTGWDNFLNCIDKEFFFFYGFSAVTPYEGIMLSEPIQITKEKIEFSFTLRYDIHTPSSNYPGIGAYVVISTDGGRTFQEITENITAEVPGFPMRAGSKRFRIDMEEYVGQAIQIGIKASAPYRDDYYQDYSFLILDDIYLGKPINYHDYIVIPAGLPYAQLPLKHAMFDLPPVIVYNPIGNTPKTETLLTVKGGDYNKTYIVPPIEAGTYVSIPLEAYQAQHTGDVQLTYVSDVEDDRNPVDNTASQHFRITEDLFAMEDGVVYGGNGISGAPGSMGQMYTLIKRDIIHSVLLRFMTVNNHPFSIEIRDTSGFVIFESEHYTVTSEVMEIKLGVELEPGNYCFMLRQMDSNSIGLCYSVKPGASNWIFIVNEFYEFTVAANHCSFIKVKTGEDLCKRVSDLKGNDTGEDIELNWESSSPTTYTIMRDGEIIATKVADNRYTDQGAGNANYNYTYCVIADCKNDQSAPVCIDVLAKTPPPVIDLSATVQDQNILLDWEIEENPEDIPSGFRHFEAFSLGHCTWSFIDNQDFSVINSMKLSANVGFSYIGPYSRPTCLTCGSIYGETREAWAISSGIPLVAGQEYEISVFYVGIDQTQNDRFQLTAGLSQQISDQTIIISDVKIMSKDRSFAPITASFTAPATGNFYFGIHAMMPPNNGISSWDNFEIRAIMPSEDYHFNLYRNDDLIASRIHQFDYIDLDLPKDHYDYCIKSVSNYGESAPKCIQISMVNSPEIEDSHIAIYPTYTSGLIKIDIPNKATIRIMNVSGEVLATYSVDGHLDINLDLADGLYLIAVDTKTQKSIHKIILKKP